MELIYFISYDLSELITLFGTNCSNNDEASGFVSHNKFKSAAKCIFMLFGSVKIVFIAFKSSFIDDHPSSNPILFCKLVKNLCCLSVLHA